LVTSVPGDPHGDADVGLLHRGRVVDAVAGHRDDLAFLPEDVDQADLLLWADAGPPALSILNPSISLEIYHQL
jgi:hypothetical protein